jgi:hypothetical protein
MGLSPILPGSPASAALAAYLRSQLEPLGFEVREDLWTTPDAPVPLRNVIADRGRGPALRVIGAHMDTRHWADEDPDPARRRDPVPGANDGGSGVAVLLELARSVQEPAGTSLRLAFFDAEDQGGIPGWAGWTLGSRRMASRLGPEEVSRIEAVIIVDIVGEANLRLVREGASDPDLAARIWAVGRELGYEATFPEGVAPPVTDDHVPFVRLGLPAVDLVPVYGSDGSPFFPWHHTTLDTLDRVSRASLGRVGRTLEAFLEAERAASPTPGMALRRGAVPTALAAAGLALAAIAIRRRRRRTARLIRSRAARPRRRAGSRRRGN